MPKSIVKNLWTTQKHISNRKEITILKSPESPSQFKRFSMKFWQNRLLMKLFKMYVNGSFIPGCQTSNERKRDSNLQLTHNQEQVVGWSTVFYLESNDPCQHGFTYNWCHNPDCKHIGLFTLESFTYWFGNCGATTTSGSRIHSIRQLERSFLIIALQQVSCHGRKVIWKLQTR